MRKLPQFIFLLFHLLFIGFAIFESKQQLFQLTALILITSLLIYFYTKHISKKKDSTNHEIRLETIFFVIAGGLSTFLLQDQLQLNAVLSAGIIGLTGGFLPKLTDHRIASIASPAIYCGAFVGMTPAIVAGNYFFILLASFSAGCILIILRGDFNGYAGKLGTIAFAGVSLVSLLTYILL